VDYVDYWKTWATFTARDDNNALSSTAGSCRHPKVVLWQRTGAQGLSGNIVGVNPAQRGWATWPDNISPLTAQGFNSPQAGVSELHMPSGISCHGQW